MANQHYRRPTIAAHYWSIYDLELDEACRLAKSLGYEGLDLAIGDLGSGPRLELEVLAADPSACERIAEVGHAHDLTFTDFVAAVVSAPDMSDEQRQHNRETFARFAPRADVLGLRGVTVLPGFYPEGQWEASFELVAEELRRYVDAAAANGLVLSIEAHLDSVTDTPERALMMLDAVDGLSLTLDYSHFVYSGHTQSEIEPLHAHARHFHIRQAAPGRLAAPVDEGTIDHRRLLEQLRSSGYPGALTTEYVPSEWYDQNLVDTAVENEAMRRELVPLIDELWA